MGDGKGTWGCPPGSNRGGGPATAEGEARAIANLHPPGQPQTAAIKHGAHAQDGFFMLCARCCAREDCAAYREGGDCTPEREYIRERRAAIFDLCPHLDPVLDGPAVSVLCWLEVRLTRAARYLAACGELLPGAEEGFLEAQPLTRTVSAMVSNWRETMKALGLTPIERRRLEDKGEGGPAAELAKAFAELAREDRERAQARQAETVDADFEADDDEPGGADDDDRSRAGGAV